MAQEIEKKFLVKGDFKGEAFKATRITQGYLCSVPERTVRIRVKGDKGFITVKGKGDGAAHPEFEYEIPASDARQLLSLCEPPVIVKTRYIVNHEGNQWEVDEFHGDLEGLVIAELEVPSEDYQFARPAFVGQEVTGAPRYYNSQLGVNL